MKNFTNFNSYGEIKSRDTDENRELLELSDKAFKLCKNAPMSNCKHS